MRRFILSAFCGACALSALAQDQSVYSEALENGWQNWSWATVSLSSTAQVHSGAKSISVTPGAYQAVYLEHPAFDSAPFASISFWIHGGPSGGQQLQLQGLLSGSAKTGVAIRPTNGWQQVTVALASLGVDNKPDLDGFWIQDTTGGNQATFYVDDVRLIASTTPPPAPAAITLLVDAAANRRPIDPRIYGMCFASQAQVADLNTPLNRSGGNTESRYNWQINAHNRGADWYFQSIADSSSTPAAESDAFITATKNNGAQPMMTVPLLDWAPKLGANRGKLASFSIAKYGAQTGRDDAYYPDAGNGIRQESPRIYVTGNDLNDANLSVNTAFKMDWVRHLTNRWGLSANGGVRYYILDNEPTLWHSTHRDIKPAGVTMRELRDKYFDYAPKIKDLDPGALIVGPEEWGWSGYFYSGADQQAGPSNNWSRFPDREANGNKDFMPWFLEQMRLQSTTAGRRLLDIFTLHYYPQENEYGNDTSSSTQLKRARSTRSLWDPSYTDTSWINDKIRLIPRMREWVNTNYPGTQIGLTEYSWGADNHISGATAQADVFGILGREGMDLATRWTTPGTGSPTYNAIKMYRNYDGKKSAFGETSIKANAPDVDKVSIFAALRTNDNALTIVAINKQLTATAPALLTVTNFSAALAQRWQLTSANAITKLPDQTSNSGVFSNTLPAQSITLFVLTSSSPRLSSPKTEGDLVKMTLNGIAGKNYAIETSGAMTSWSPIQTNTAPSNTFEISVTRPSETQFYRAAQLD